MIIELHALVRPQWLQFSLRTLLVVVLIACLPLGWFNFKLERKRRQRRAADAIAGAGGSVWYLGPERLKAAASYPILPYDSQLPETNALQRLIEGATAGDVAAVAFRGGPVGDLLANEKRGWLPHFAVDHQLSFDGQGVAGSSTGRWLLDGDVRDYELIAKGISPNASIQELDWCDLQAFPALEVLSLGDRAVGPDAVRQIAMLKQLRCLFIHNGKQLNDERLSELSALTMLRVLVIDKSQITDEGLRHLSGLANLEVLELDHALIRGDGLRHLAALTNLKVISLRFTSLEDAGLAHLKNLTGLQRLYLFKTNVTDVGLRNVVGLQQLEILHLGKTNVTYDGANAFEELLGRTPIIR